MGGGGVFGDSIGIRPWNAKSIGIVSYVLTPCLSPRDPLLRLKGSKFQISKFPKMHKLELKFALIPFKRICLDSPRMHS